jgi:transcription antitermination factor NusG
VNPAICGLVPDWKGRDAGSAGNVTGFSGAMSNLATTVSSDPTNPLHDAPCADTRWYAVQTWPRYEKKVAVEFQRKAVEAFLPLLSSEHQWSDRRRTVQLPLFPGYVFVKIGPAPSARIPVLRANGVVGFVGSRGIGVPIPDSEIDSVRLLLDRGIAFQPYPFLNVGQRVRVRGGSLDAVEGILLAKKDDLSLVVSVQIIQRSISIRISGYQVEAA